ncbi:MAG: hypothetical protein PVF04_00965 [Anaerolineae bacterium]|jgi:hypothetical protein
MSVTDYEIIVEGHLDHSRWSRWFEGMDLTLIADGTTVISGSVPDQAKLHGLLAKVRDLGLILISVQRADPGAAAEAQLEQGAWKQ